ncbi:Hypothetical protein R9X50_00199400 [Acrodontium crateriforme]|uniref:Uncharacterized protein n=1 Tax=Acrodontium crateriforme TaxID=150365 RepID=A0AAQ3M0E6_9PEZI|nr:Hypothetical protein R9X50_00199400 [Acrodontium crateriforme]
MVAYYEIMGQKVGSHVLSIATLSTMFVGSWMMMGGSKKTIEKAPPINASSKDEENFITEFLKSADAEGREGKAKH